MNTMIESRERTTLTTETTSQVAHETSDTITTTTLYDLIATIQAAINPGEGALVVPIAAHMLQAGRATFLREGPSYQSLSYA